MKRGGTGSAELSAASTFGFSSLININTFDGQAAAVVAYAGERRMEACDCTCPTYPMQVSMKSHPSELVTGCGLYLGVK